MNDDISRALDVLNHIDDPHEERHHDEALQVLMSVASDTPAIHTGHSSTTVITPGERGTHDPATATLESIATGEDDDIASLTALMEGKSYDNFG